MLCNHEWEYRSGMDGGHVCVFCSSVKESNADTNSMFKKLTCHHSWRQASGLSSGAVCTECGLRNNKDKPEFTKNILLSEIGRAHV